MDLTISNLVIEVTRKCNMNCSHCLRGASQRKTIPDNYIYKILQLIDNVYDLTITGGEPTLAFDSLEQIRNCVIYGNCDVNSFYMVTNGKAINVEKLAQWAWKMTNCCSDNEMSGIGFSFDDFHTDTLQHRQEAKRYRNFHRLQELLDYDYGIFDAGAGVNFTRKHSTDNWRADSLIREGRAKDWGGRDNDKYYFLEDSYDDNIIFGETELYLSCSGYIVSGCNWSYHTIDNRKDIRICHIDDINCQDDLIEAIRVYNKEQVFV